MRVIEPGERRTLGPLRSHVPSIPGGCYLVVQCISRISRLVVYVLTAWPKDLESFQPWHSRAYLGAPALTTWPVFASRSQLQPSCTQLESTAVNLGILPDVAVQLL